MRLLMRRRFGCCQILLGMLGMCAPALAIGPAGQTISPTDDRVVRVLINADLPNGDGYMEGTGSVVANTNVNGSGYLWVLTADHVISVTNSYGGSVSSGLGIAFGNSPTSDGNSAYFAGATAGAGRIFRGGPTGTEDLALFGIKYGTYDPSKDALRMMLAPDSDNPAFTDIGYGDEGDLVSDGYQAQFKYGTQRYFNQEITSFANGPQAGGYVYNAARFYIIDPSDPDAPAASGAALDADSGSPLLTSNFNGTYYTESQFAILTSVTPIPENGDFRFGSTEFAMALSAADLAWINTSAGVPEPSLLAPLIAFAFLLTRRRSGLRIGSGV